MYICFPLRCFSPLFATNNPNPHLDDPLAWLAVGTQSQHESSDRSATQYREEDIEDANWERGLSLGGCLRGAAFGTKDSIAFLRADKAIQLRTAPSNEKEKEKE